MEKVKSKPESKPSEKEEIIPAKEKDAGSIIQISEDFWKLTDRDKRIVLGNLLNWTSTQILSLEGIYPQTKEIEN